MAVSSHLLSFTSTARGQAVKTVKRGRRSEEKRRCRADCEIQDYGGRLFEQSEQIFLSVHRTVTEEVDLYTMQVEG